MNERSPRIEPGTAPTLGDRRNDRRPLWIGACLLLGVAVAALAMRGPSASVDGYLVRPAEHPVAELLAEPARLHVVYWPAPGTCQPHEMRLILRLREFLDETAEVRAVSVLPDGWPYEERYGVELPGEVARLPMSEYERQAALAPIPRVEVWNAEGKPLMLRSLPGFGDQATLLIQELTGALSTTRPLSESISEM